MGISLSIVALATVLLLWGLATSGYVRGPKW